MISEIVKLYFNLLFFPKYPLMFMIYLNNFCNLKCSFCEIGQRNNTGWINKANTELSKEQIEKVVNLCVKTGSKRIYITGGEPFLSKSIWYLLEKCCKNNIIVEDITTNGTFLNALGTYEIDLINKNTLDIIISIDSADEIKHDMSRGVAGTFQKIRSFMLNEDKRSLYRCSFSFNVVVQSKNINELKNIIDLAVAWNIKHINFQPISPATIFVDMETMQNKEELVPQLEPAIFNEYMDQLIKYSEENNISTDLSVFKLWAPFYFNYLNKNELFFDFFPPKFLCSKVFNYIHINYNGDLIPCANLKPIANIDHEDCFEKWQENAQKLKILFNKKKYFNNCRYCFCDFPTSLRISLVYFPIQNMNLLFKLARYYLDRAKDKRI